MPEKRRAEKIKPAAELEKITTEILVANRRAVEPFIKIFNYSGENITVSQLGTLVGVFEVSEQSEESAYIVNFLASVAKKEYFNNPRRGAVESFEAALHKINLALSTLVKHGNVSWLGKLQGALGVLEKNNIHFSVTGKAKILLLRNDNFSEISLGLASEESSLHPLKTFAEVASGRLLENDKILIASPKLFTILSIDDLKKNATRMDNERFTQFLRTVLVNELDIAGVILLDVYASLPVLTRKPEIKNEETVNNVFSQKAFVPLIKVENANAENQKEEKTKTPQSEYIDSKTGHIYVQGDTPKESLTHPGLARAKFLLQETGYKTIRFFIYRNKFLRKVKKQGFIFFDILTERGFIITQKTSHFLQGQLKKGYQPFTKSARPSLITELQPTPAKEKEGTSTFASARYGTKFYTDLRLWWRKFTLKIPYFFQRLFLVWNHSTPQRQKIILAVSALSIVLLIGGIGFIKRQPPETSNTNRETSQASDATAASLPLNMNTEKNARLLPEPFVLATGENPNIVSVLLNNEVYLVTTKDILNVRENKHYTLPAGSGAPLFAAPMDDLLLIFIYTNTGALFAWSPLNHSFISNTLILPEKILVKDIDAYLTYLYVLDSATNQIYRFPRAEGGFGEPLAWLKDTVALEENTQIAVNENIFLSTNKNTVQIFFRGRYVKNLESPNTELSITHLFTHPGLANVYALDAEHKRILVWDQNSALIAQYFSEKLASALTLTVNEKTSEAIVTTADSLLSFKLEK